MRKNNRKNSLFIIGKNKDMKYILILTLIGSSPIHIKDMIKEHDEINEFINETESQFYKEYHAGNQLYIDYECFLSAYESYLFYVTFDFQGAHPITKLKTFNYTKGQFIDIKSVINYENYFYFYLKAEEILIPKLKKEGMFLEEMFYSGIAPKEENYRHIIMNENYFLIFFEQYQIAPYASGIHSMKVYR